MKKYYYFVLVLCSLAFAANLNAAQLSGGSGLEADPYQVKTVKDLEEMADAVAKGTTFKGIYFRLMNDITLEEPLFSIGSKTLLFNGAFDGNNKTISNLIIFPTGLGSGLFGGTDTDACIKNLTVASGKLVIVGDEKEVSSVGTICGYNKGSIIDCRVKDVTLSAGKSVGGIAGSNIGGTIEGCSFYGKASGEWWIGGIVGSADKGGTKNTCGSITNCHNSGIIFGIKHVGGIAGAFNNIGNISQCYNTGNISISGGSETGSDYETEAAVGGIVGYAYNASIEKCANFGSIESVFSASSPYVGGIVGNCQGLTIRKCYNTKMCQGTNGAKVGGIVGRFDGSSPKMEHCYTTAPGLSDLSNGSGELTSTYYKEEGITACFYDKQIGYINGATGKGALTREMIGNALATDFGAEDWVYEEGMYPRLKGMESVPTVILAASPAICYANEEGTIFDKMTTIAHDITIATSNSLSWTVDNTEYFKIENNKVLLLKRPTEDLIVSTLKASLENYSIAYTLSIALDLGGDGSEASPYQIKSVKQFNYIATMTTGGETFLGKHIKLMNDLDMKGDEENPSKTVGYKGGNITAPFNGIFDGNNHVIDHFYCKNEGNTHTTGLFRYVGGSGVIKNLTLGKGSYIEGQLGIGGIVGTLAGTVYNCTNYATVYGITGVGGVVGTAESKATGNLYNCINSGNITSTRGNVGGIMGDNSAFAISKCCNFGKITVDGTGSNPQQAGGIIGYTTQMVSDCINAGVVEHLVKTNRSVAGGIVGRTSGSVAAPAVIKNCINTGSVLVTELGKAGSIIGELSKNDKLQNCYYDAQMCIDDRDYEESIPLSVSELTSGNTLKGFDASTWTFSSKLYPMIKELASTDAGKLAATPFYLAAGNNFTTVRENFKVGGVAEGVVWTSDNAAATVNGENIVVTLPEITTRCNFIGAYHGEEKVVSIFILDKKSAAGIANHPTKGDFKMYAVNRNLTIENVQNATISICDLTGKVINEQHGLNNAVTIALPASGLYVVKVIKGSHFLVEKIIVK